MQNLKIYLVTTVVFFLVDIVWLGFISKNLYSKYLGHLMAPRVNWIAALIFYALFIVGLMFFVINPALAKKSLSYAIVAGGLFWAECLFHLRLNKSSYNQGLATEYHDY